MHYVMKYGWNFPVSSLQIKSNLSLSIMHVPVWPACGLVFMLLPGDGHTSQPLASPQ